MKTIAIALFTVVSGIATIASAQSNLVTRADVPYTQTATENGPMTLKLDFSAPRSACTTPRPTMVMIHGGGYKTGDRKSRIWKKFANSFADEGWNSVSISYRLVSDRPVIDQRLMSMIPDDMSAEDRDQAIAGAGSIETTIKALEFLKKNASQACVDTDNIFLIGSSAGGVTSLNTTFMVDEIGARQPDVAGVVSYWGGLSDIDAMDSNDVPVFIIHGTADRTVPFSKSTDLYARGQATGTPVQLHGFNGRGHSWSEFNAYQDTINGQPIVDVMIDWIDTIVSGRRSTTNRTSN